MLLPIHNFSLTAMLKWAITYLSVALLCGCSPTTQQNNTSKVGSPLSKRPNIVVIMADDMGFSDIGEFGSEIPTPHLDKIAQEGTKFSRFYTSASCSPSRAMLLTGADNHLVGIGNMAETIMDNQIGKPGYETYLNQKVATFAEDLQSQGYHTYMAGKWHLGLEREQGPAERGFEQSFSLMFGGGSHYSNGFGPDKHRNVSLYRDNGKLIKELPDDFYSSDFYTDRIIKNIQEQQSSNKPFIAYLAFTAPHWPLQFPPDYKGEFADTYKVGWEKIRQRRLEKIRRSGLFKGDFIKDIDSDNFANWDALSADERALAARDMEIYAAMVTNLDTNVGRLVKYLKKQDMYDNTFILFLSDNGAEHWSNETAPPVIASFANEFNNALENRGQPDSFVFYGEAWARVSNTPFRQFKGTTYEGGIHAPAFMKMPHGQKHVEINDKVIGIEMVKSALLDIANSRSASSSNPMFIQAADENTTYLGREMWGKQGIINDEWALVKVPKPQGTGQWQLFNVINDPAQTTDLAKQRPAIAERLMQHWQDYVKENGVVMPEGKFIIRPPGELPID